MNTDETKKLVYRIAAHNGGVVFAPLQEALRVSRIHRAIEESNTWGEFKKLMPEEDYRELVENIKQITEEMGEEKFVPVENEHFNCEQIPGYMDGDYPTWLQQEMDMYLPRDILERYAQRETTFLNGSFWMIPEENLDLICKELVDSGWELIRKEEWDFH